MKAERALVALGANVGRREQNILKAVREISRDVGEVVALSRLYENPAVGMGDAPSFINAAAEVQTLLSPFDLLERLKDIEIRMGRRDGHYLPRAIDLDIIAVGAQVIKNEALTVPHPRFAQRAFVLVPLADVADDFVCPKTGRAIADLIREVDVRGVVAITSRAILAGNAS